MNTQEAINKLEEQFDSRLAFLAHQISMLSMVGQPCDVTFFNKRPVLDVKFDQKINIALMYGAGATKLRQMLESIELSNGDRVSISEIWTINPMPRDGFTAEQLATVDLNEGDDMVGPDGETLRQMISETYHCQSHEEENMFLRRFIAS